MERGATRANGHIVKLERIIIETLFISLIINPSYVRPRRDVEHVCPLSIFFYQKAIRLC